MGVSDELKTKCLLLDVEIEKFSEGWVMWRRNPSPSHRPRDHFQLWEAPDERITFDSPEEVFEHFIKRTGRWY